MTLRRRTVYRMTLKSPNTGTFTVDRVTGDSLGKVVKIWADEGRLALNPGWNQATIEVVYAGDEEVWED